MPVFPDPQAATLQLSLLQFTPILRDLAANAEAIRNLTRSISADLVVTPELSLTGYDLRDTGAEVASQAQRQLDLPLPTLAGAVESANGGLLYNVAMLAMNGTADVVHRKVYLPTYGMFDEGRYFARGDRVIPFELGGWRIGVLICEDFWHPSLTYLLAMQGIHVLVVMAAAPGRGALAGGENGGFFASSDSWERIARTTAQLYGIYVVVCNRTGVEGGITFGGESLAVAPDASLMARAGVEVERIDIRLERDFLISSRRPYAHLRDEDTRFVVAELQRIGTHVRG